MQSGILGNIKVFLSHTSADEAEVLRYAEMLKRRGFAAWTYQVDMTSGGEEISAELQKHVRQCDFFLLFVSDASANSPYVQLELGIAESLQQERRELDRQHWDKNNPNDNAEFKPTGTPHRADALLSRPEIIPIFVSDAEWRQSNQRPTSFPTRLSLDGQPTGAYTLDRKGHDPRARPTDTDDHLVRQMTPMLRVFGLQSDDPNTMSREAMRETDVFELYETLFPEIERDKPADIETWVFERDVGIPQSYTVRCPTWFGTSEFKFTNHCDSWFPVLTLRGKAIAFAFLSYDLNVRLMYGNFVGVQQAWRPSAIADVFWKQMQGQTLESFPYCRGMIFEVETFDFEDVERIVADLENQPEASRKFKEQHSTAAVSDQDIMRRFLRLVWYDSRGARVFRDNNDNILVNSYPCLDPDLPETQWQYWQEDFWPAWFPAKSDTGEPDPTWREIVDFSSMIILVQALLIEYPGRGPEYLKYAQNLIKRVVARAKGGQSRVSRMMPSKSYNRLFRRWRALKIPLAI